MVKHYEQLTQKLAHQPSKEPGHKVVSSNTKLTRAASTVGAIGVHSAREIGIQ